MNILDVINHIVENRNLGQAISLALLVILLTQIVFYLRKDKTYAPLFAVPIIIIIEGIAFYSYVVIAAPAPSASVTTVSWLLRFQTIAYFCFLMQYLIRKRRIEKTHE